jgi:hypothetical protein
MHTCSHHSCRIESPLKLTIIFSYRLLSPHLHLFLIRKPSKIARLHGPRTGLGQAYNDDLLCITRGTLEDHLDKLEEVLKRLRDTGLKVNAAKSFCCTHEIKYLGYMLTRGGIKPQIKKVQAILAIKPPNNVKELRHFLGMVQYYHDMWAKRSEMLAPLSDLVEECGETKTTHKNKVKRNLGSGI